MDSINDEELIAKFCNKSKNSEFDIYGYSMTLQVRMNKLKTDLAIAKAEMEKKKTDISKYDQQRKQMINELGFYQCSSLIFMLLAVILAVLIFTFWTKFQT